MSTPESLVDEARGIVVTAGEIIRENFEKPVAIKHKGSIDLVTETDLAVEHYLKERLGTLLPKADFLAEETASSVTPGPLTWIIDPIDGTTNYAHGFPFVAVSVALWERDRVVMGIVHLPILNETFAAVRGRALP